MKSQNDKKPTVLAIIPARAGSKRLPGKNHKIFHGKPLIEWTIKSALDSRYIDEIVITSNDKSVLDIGSSFNGVSCIDRAEEISGDKASSVEVVVDVLKTRSYFEYFILLQPTSPLRGATHIDEALTYTFKNFAPSCVSLCSAIGKSDAMYQFRTKNNIELINKKLIAKKQSSIDISSAYILNGAIYINKVSTFLEKRAFVGIETIGYVMNTLKSVDIDTIEDFNLAERNFNLE
jgi:N-acylneuraminate cytidylyltransferase